MILSHLGISRHSWPLILAPTQGLLPQDAVQYRAFLIYLRRQGHLNDTNQDVAKNPRQQYFVDSQQQHQQHEMPQWNSHQYFADPSSDWQGHGAESDWTGGASAGAYWTADEEEIASTGASETEQPDFTDIAGMTAEEKGEFLYHAYVFAKSRFRAHTGQPSRRKGKGKGRRKGKGKGKHKGKFDNFGHGKSSNHFWALEPWHDSNAWQAAASSPVEWHDDDWATTASYASAYAFAKGGKGRTNPVGPDGKIMKCLQCGSESHFRNKCPQASSHGSSCGKGSGKPGASGYLSDMPGTGSTSQGRSMLDNPRGIGHWMPGHHSYFAADDFLPNAVAQSAIIHADGTRELLETHDNDKDKDKKQDASYITKVLNFFAEAYAWWNGAYHTQVRLKEGEGLLVDCGAVANLCGSRWSDRVTALAARAGQGATFTAIDPLPINGVGKGASECNRHGVLPVLLRWQGWQLLEQHRGRQ